MHGLMLIAEPHGARNAVALVHSTRRVETLGFLPYHLLMGQDLIKRRPGIRDFGMRVTFLGIVNVRVDSAFEDLPKIRRVCGLAVGRSCHMYVKEGGNVAQVENAGVA